MPYKDEEKRRSATRERVKRFRKNKEALQDVTIPVCPDCGGRGFIEFNHGLLQVACKCRS
jgi:hypothetical protein